MVKSKSAALVRSGCRGEVVLFPALPASPHIRSSVAYTLQSTLITYYPLGAARTAKLAPSETPSPLINYRVLNTRSDLTLEEWVEQKLSSHRACKAAALKLWCLCVVALLWYLREAAAVDDKELALGPPFVSLLVDVAQVVSQWWIIELVSCWRE